MGLEISFLLLAALRQSPRHCVRAPSLSRPLARRYLAVPATTTESERMFSLAGAVVSPMRTRLSPARVNELVVVRAHYLRADRGAREGEEDAGSTDNRMHQDDMREEEALEIDSDDCAEEDE
jgi:hypothetical protein